MSNRLQISASHPAGVSVMSHDDIAERLGVAPMTEAEKAEDKKKLVLGIDNRTAGEFAWEAASTGLPIPGAGHVATIAAVPFSWFMADYKARRELGKLTDDYRDAIATHMGVAPEQVTDHMTLSYAQHNDNLRGAIEYIADKRETTPVTNMMGVGGLLAGGAIGTAMMPGLGTIGGAIAGMGFGLLGFEGGKAIGDRMLGIQDGRDPQAIMDAIAEKKEKGEIITAKDVFALRAAQRKEIQETIQHHYDKPFHLLDAADQLDVMQHMVSVSQGALRDAVCCNAPDADLRHLMLGEMPPPPSMQPTQWTSRVTHSRGAMPQQGQWTDAIRQQQAAAAMPLQVEV